MKVQYFAGLNGLRAIAAIAVVFSHINISAKEHYHVAVSALDLANFGVTLFFTLSGFLITHLLLVEKEVTHSVSIKKFYIRRLLRIWPLYFLYLSIILIVLKFAVGSEILYYLFFIPNVAFALGAGLPFLAHYWSLGVEEQFYMIWPWITKRFTKLPLVFSGFILAFIGLKVFIGLVVRDQAIATLLHYSRFGTMAIGGLCAWYYVFDKKKLAILLTWPIHALSWGIVGLVALNSFHISSMIDHELFSCATVVLILNQIEGAQSRLSLERPWLSYLGNISFGIYVYNPLLIHFLMPYLGEFFLAGEIPGMMAAYAVITSATIAVAHISYHYFEKRFLGLKERYSFFSSGVTGSNGAINAKRGIIFNNTRD